MDGNVKKKFKNRFYNPIKQNRTHLKWLGKYLSEDIPLFSIIVFSERCELKKVVVESTDIPVIKRDRLYAAVRDIWNQHEDKLDETKVAEIYNQLKSLTNVDEAAKRAHIDSINKRYKGRTQDENIEEKKEIPKICPRCGSELILRIAKKGDNVGKQFYGCSTFPKCRYIENIESKPTNFTT